MILEILRYSAKTEDQVSANRLSSDLLWFLHDVRIVLYLVRGGVESEALVGMRVGITVQL